MWDTVQQLVPISFLFSVVSVWFWCIFVKRNPSYFHLHSFFFAVPALLGPPTCLTPSSM